MGAGAVAAELVDTSQVTRDLIAGFRTVAITGDLDQKFQCIVGVKRFTRERAGRN